MNHKKYQINTFLMAAFASPLLMFVSSLMNEMIPLAGIIPVIGLVMMWKRWVRKHEMPDEAGARY